MHTVTLSPQFSGDGNPHHDALLKIFTDNKKQAAKVYRTFIDSRPNGYTFVTTSKDIYLAIGSLDWRNRLTLAQFLCHEFDKYACFQLLFSKDRLDDDGKSDVFLVTLSKDPGVANDTVLTFSPAH